MSIFECVKARKFALRPADGELIDICEIRPYIDIIETELNEISENCKTVLKQIKRCKEVTK
jgi:hypothetical protein